MVFGRAHGHQVSIQRLCDKEMVWSDEGQRGERLEVLGIKFLWSRLEKEQSERMKKKREQYVKRKRKGKTRKGKRESKEDQGSSMDNMEK